MTESAISQQWAAAIDELCSRARRGELGGRPTAALDFDNSCIAGDVGETLHYHLCDTHGYDLDGEFWGAVDVADGRERLESAWRAYRSGAPLPQGYESDLIAVYARRYLREGRRAVYGWAATMHAGMAPAQVAEAAVANLEIQKGRPMGRVPLVPTPDGLLLTRSQGIRSRPVVQRWVQQMDAAGIEVWVVSATNVWAVSEVARRELAIPTARVIGNSCEVERGRITHRALAPTIYKEGKLAAFREATGQTPVMSLGDTVSDRDLLRSASALAILVDRGDLGLAAEAGERGWLVVDPATLDAAD